MTYVGTDVSKAAFLVAYSFGKGSKTKSFKDTYQQSSALVYVKVHINRNSDFPYKANFMWQL